MIRFPVAIVFLAALISAFAEDDFKVVETDLGHVRGRVLHTLLDNRPFFAFRGIPYAKVPVGVLRFKPPQSPEPWTKVHDALSFGNACTQLTFDMKSIVGDEDCLFINVFTPELSPATPLPVLVAVHGGGYYVGSGEWLGPDFLLNEDVVLVTFNYRLGPLGFLSMGTADYPGNQGLKDQLLALRWVNRNIHKFGGDNAKITLYGQSAGASAVHLHMVSPQSHGLFQRAILSSGSALDTWSYNTRPKHMEVLEKLATVAGVSIKTDSDVAQFLATVDAKLLVEKTHKPFYIPFTDTKEGDLLWAPVIEAPDAIEPFLQENPEKLLREQSSESHIDTLFGFNNAESLFVTALELSKPESLVSFNKDFNVQLPLRHIKYEYNSDIYREYASEIRKFYFGDKNVTKSLVEFSDLMSDVLFNYGIHVAARDHARLSAANTFYYIFSVERGLNILRQYINASALSLPGSTHADELGYLFRVGAADVVPQEIYATLTSDSEEAKLVRQMTKLFANFAAFGTPTPKGEPVAWKPIKDGVINYVNITNDGLVSGVNPNDKRFAFWDNFFKRNSRSLWETDHDITVDELLIITGHI